MKGRIYGIGVGTGDPEDITLKAIRLIKESDVLACPRKDLAKCRAYQIAKQAIPEIGSIETLAFEFEMTRDVYECNRNHKKIYDTVKELVFAGKKVAFLTIGDPALYSTYSYIAELARRDGIDTYSVSGISSVSACANSLGIPLCEGGEQLHVIPNTENLEEFLGLPGTKVVMKCGRDMRRVKEKLKKERNISVYAVSECGTTAERCYRGIEELPDDGNYMMTLLVKNKEEKD